MQCNGSKIKMFNFVIIYFINKLKQKWKDKIPKSSSVLFT